MKHLVKNIATAATLCVALNAFSATVTVTGVSGTGSYNNSVSLIVDGVIPGESSGWTGVSNVWWYGTTPVFTLTFDQIYTLQDVTVSVDNNDNYRVRTSLDNTNWSNLFSIMSNYGEVGWGMDTMSSVSGSPEYVSGIDFSATNAKYVQIFATGGDNMYSVGELAFTGTVVSSVPEPASLALVGLGLAGLAVARRRKTQE